MRNFLRKIKHRLIQFGYRRNYYLAKIWPNKVPTAPLHYLPDGFTVHHVADTGLRVVDNFCTTEESAYLINNARDQLSKSHVIEDGKAVIDSGRTSAHSVAFHRTQQDPHVLPIIARGAMLAGVPVQNAEQIYVSRYGDGELYHGHYDFSDSFLTDHRLCTILIYLNGLDEDQGGATYFKDLNLAVKPTAGRAVIWTNVNPDGSKHLETVHAALPPRGENAEKWVIQLWFRPYRMLPIANHLQPRQVTAGTPLSGSEALPSGLWALNNHG